MAIKVLHERHRDNEHALERLEREAQLLAKVDHPNVARPVAVRVKGDGPPYLATEFVDGRTLASIIRERSHDADPFSMEEIQAIFEDLCSAIDHAHSKSVIHRDLKPENIMIQRRGWRSYLKVLDFGVAKFLEADLTRATTLGRRIGTIMYMSPEQTAGAPTTARSDIFALGIILFELLTLRRPWAWDEQGRARPAHEGPFPMSSGQISEVLSRIATADRPRPGAHRSGLPPAIDEVLLNATAVDPEERYASVEELVRSFRLACGASDFAVREDRTEPVELGSPVDERSVPIERTESGAGRLYDTAVGGAPMEASDAAHTDPEWPDKAPTAYAGSPEAPRASRTGARAWAAIGLAGALVVSAIAASPEPPAPAIVADDPPEPARVTARAIVEEAPPVEPPPPPRVERRARPPALRDPVRAKPRPRMGRMPREDRRSGAAGPPASARFRSLRAPPAPVPPKDSPLRQRLAELEALERDVRANPDDMGRLLALARAIGDAARLIEDPRVRARIVELATSSADVGDREGVLEAYRDLLRALGRSDR